jgi:opacity protein-like surface antigen
MTNTHTALRRLLLAAAATLLAIPASAQVVPAFRESPSSLTAGIGVSGFKTGYANLTGSGSSHNYGITPWVDYNLNRNLGIELEYRALRFNQSHNVYQDTYLAGPRYSLPKGRFTPYAKVLVGTGTFNFPVNLGHSTYTALAYGAGIDLRLSQHLRLRAADFEYQQWLGFQGSTTLNPWGLTTGLSWKFYTNHKFK